jgi:hypothetical protein
MTSAVDLSTNSVTSVPQTRAEEARSKTTAYLWIGLVLFGLVIIGGVAGSYYMNTLNIIDEPYVGPVTLSADTSFSVGKWRVFSAIRRASSLVSSLGADRLRSSSPKNGK